MTRGWSSVGLFLFVWELWAGSARGEARFQDWRLEIGRAAALQVGEAETLHLSRKGLVDTLWLGENRWRITALKAGFVLLRVIGRDGVESQRVMLEVVKPEAQEATQGWACPGVRLHCDRDAGLVAGTTDSWAEYLSAQEVCSKVPGCRFVARLDPTGLERFGEDLVRFVDPGARVEVSSSGRIMMALPCHGATPPQGFEDRLTRLGVPQQSMGVVCRDDAMTHGYQPKAKIFYIKEDDLKDLDLGLSVLGPIAALPRPRLTALMEHKKENILSAPELQILMGEPFELRSGGEIHIPGYKERPDEWKAYGVVLKGEVQQIAESRFAVTYELGVTTPSKEAEGRLDGSYLKSMAKLALAMPEIIGEVDAVFQVDREEGVPLAQDIPVVGPLFRGRQSQNAKTKLYLWLTIEKL